MGAIRDGLLAEYDHEVATTRRLLERLPDEKLNWKPHEKSMSLGGLATHLGNIPNGSREILTQPHFDLASVPTHIEALTTRAEILRFFDDSTRQARLAMDKTAPEDHGLGAL